MFERSITRRHKGFTLAELLVVIMILGIASSVVIPMMGGNYDIKLTSAARQLVSAILYAQTSAIANQSPCQIVFDTANNTYELQDTGGTTMTDPVTGKAYRVDFPNNKQYKKITFNSVDIDDGAVVKFNTLGIPYNSDDTEMVDVGVIVLTADGQTSTVQIDPVTGRVSSP